METESHLILLNLCRNLFLAGDGTNQTRLIRENVFSGLRVLSRSNIAEDDLFSLIFALEVRDECE